MDGRDGVHWNYLRVLPTVEEFAKGVDDGWILASNLLKSAATPAKYTQNNGDERKAKERRHYLKVSSPLQ
ncbi:unnamed protein product [Victoria cruziana]